MKPLIKTIAFIVVLSVPMLLKAQQITIPLDSLQFLPKEIASAGKFTLRISRTTKQQPIRVAEKGNIANKIPSKLLGGITTYVFDSVIKEMPAAGRKEFAILDEKNSNAEIGSFVLLKGAGSGGTVTAPQESRTTFTIANSDEGNKLPIAFYDAQVIYNAYVESGGQIPYGFLSKYNFDFSNCHTSQDSLNVLLQNPFLKQFAQAFVKTKKTDATNEANANSIFTGALAALGGIDVTKYVQATADFLRDRVKEELAIAFIDKFKATIDKIPELKAVFPKTYNVFNSSDVFKVPTMGQTYKTAFQEDLQNFIENFELFVDTTTDAKYVPLKTNQAFTAFRIAYHVIDMSANDYHPIEIFELLDVQFGYDVSITNRKQEINKYISLLNLLSQHLRRVSQEGEAVEEFGEGWIGLDELKKFNPRATLIFWGLLYQQNPAVFDEIKISGSSLTKLILDGTNVVTVYLKQFVVLINNVDARIKEFNDIIKAIKEKVEEAKKVTIADFIANADKLIEVTDFIFRLPYFKDPSGSAYYTSDYYLLWRPVIIDVIETVKGVYIKDYAKIAVNATSLIGDFSKLIDKPIFSPGFLKNFTFYSNFIVDAINADSANEVKAVLNRYAQPVRSYRVKRMSPFSISLNAYPGLYFGSERYKDGKGGHESNTTFGVTAPIGLSFNWGSAKKWSSSIFLSAVDISAALSFRWNNDTLDLPEKITLGQIFSPGVFYVLGFPNVPISAKIGAQYTPQLRAITENGNTISDIGAVRYGISVAVDIPVFNFFNRSRLPDENK